MRISAVFVSTLPLALGARLLKARGGTPLDSYIVVLKETYNGGEVTISDVEDGLGDVNKTQTYTNAVGFRGFAAKLNATQLDSLKSSPKVDYIEQDAVVRISGSITSQTDADWGLARLSSRTPNGTTYKYDSTAGTGTCAYVIDTGIMIGHSEFEGRATWAGNFVDKNDTDGNGHGTHVAGTIGGVTYGVAKQTRLFAVKVLDSSGSGTNSQIIAGMNFVVQDAPKRNCSKGVVVNMSLGGDRSTAVNSAARAVVQAGYFLAVAAGNESNDTKLYSPSSEGSVCAVGATTRNDSMASYSNFGAGVALFAPGSDIKSAWNDGKTKSISGTSMATPHVAGLGAYLMGMRGPMSGSAMCDLVKKSALRGKISGLPSGTANRLAYNGGA
ncbi:hypothetical protein PspLS_11283 [Pyricularia sp. CBS 133598]|nr:hypothetical protein PspLS_11283 [Pyricularia sp. CBS 133598]